jgi:hypothetical protein
MNMENESEIIQAAKWNEYTTPDWLNKINWDEYEKLASIGYTPEKLAMFYKINKLEFMFYYMLIESELRNHYDRGILYYQAKEGMALMDDANTNTTQAQRLDKMRSDVNFQKLKDEIVYGGLQ